MKVMLAMHLLGALFGNGGTFGGSGWPRDLVCQIVSVGQ